VHIDIQANGYVVSKELKRSIHKRIHRSFKFHKRKVRKVVVRLFYTIGSRGQTIKSCRVLTVANGIPQLVTEKRSTNLMDAINSSISVSSRTVAKYLQKLKHYRLGQSRLLEQSQLIHRRIA